MEMASELELKMTEDTRNVLRDIFKSKDVDKNGIIDRKELEQCLLAVGFMPQKKDVDFLSKHFDKNGDGRLQIDELIDNLGVVNIHSLHGSELMNSFRMFDIHKDGFIRVPELQMILTAKGPHSMTIHEADELIRQLLQDFDEDGDGKFSYAEFVKMFVMRALPL